METRKTTSSHILKKVVCTKEKVMVEIHWSVHCRLCQDGTGVQ